LFWQGTKRKMPSGWESELFILPEEKEEFI
jgi:hypothetical protein